MYIDGWKNIINDKDVDECCTPAHISAIHNKAVYVAMFLYQCLGMYEKTVDFRDIIDIAMKKVNETHLIDFLPSKKRSKINFITRDRRTVIEWFYEFRKKDAFLNPGLILKHKKKQLPPLLEANPDTVKDILKFCRGNIDGLNVEMVHQFLLNECLPKLATKIQSEQDSVPYSLNDLFKDYNLSTLNIKTVRNWMIKLGFKYEPRRKTYYVDTHELS